MQFSYHTCSNAVALQYQTISVKVQKKNDRYAVSRLYNCIVNIVFINRHNEIFLKKFIKGILLHLVN